MSFINGISDFTVRTSFQPSSTATQRFCSDQIWLPWIRTATSIPCCQTKQSSGSYENQHLAVELWQAPASNRRAFGRKNRRGTQPVQDWISQTRCRNQKGPEACNWSDMTNIYLVFTCHMYQLSKSCFSRVYIVSPALSFIGTCRCKVTVKVVYFISIHFLTQNQNKNKRGIYQVYTM